MGYRKWCQKWDFLHKNNMEENYQDCNTGDREEEDTQTKQVSHLAFNLAGRSITSPAQMDRDSPPTPRDSIRTPIWHDREGSGTSVNGNGARGAFHMKVNARDFDGKKNWGEYNCHFEKICEAKGWKENEAAKLQYLWCNLSSTALSYADSLPTRETRSYRSLCEALERRFGDSRLAAVYKAELGSRQKKETESLPQLGQEIRKLVQYAYPGIGPDGIEELAIEKFREALTDQEQRKSVHQAQPITLESAVQAAMDTEAWQLAERRRNRQDNRGRVRAVTVEDDGCLEKILQRLDGMDKSYTEKMDMVVQRLDKLERRNKPMDKGGVTCFGCGKAGHYRGECPERSRRGQGRNTRQEN